MGKKQTINQTFITHHHEDHSGNVNPLAAATGTPIYGSALCSDLVKGKVHTCLAQKLFWGTPQYTDKVTPIETNFIETNKHHFELIPIPGHSADQIALYEAEEGWLFSADAFVSPIIKYFMRQESMKQQIASLRKLIALDFDLLLCCHTPLMKGRKDQLIQKLAFFEQYYGQVLHWAKLGTHSPHHSKENGEERALVRLLTLRRKHGCNQHGTFRLARRRPCPLITCGYLLSFCRLAQPSFRIFSETKEIMLQLPVINESPYELPTYATVSSAGLDLKAVLAEAVTLAPLERKIIGTGLKIELPEGYEAQVRPRSGLAAKHGITVLNAPGTIDADYRGEIGVILVNLSNEPFTVEPGERIAQLVIAQYTQIQWTLVNNLEETERGAGGFGSTGKK